MSKTGYLKISDHFIENTSKNLRKAEIRLALFILSWRGFKPFGTRLDVFAKGIGAPFPIIKESLAGLIQKGIVVSIPSVEGRKGVFQLCREPFEKPQTEPIDGTFHPSISMDKFCLMPSSFLDESIKTLTGIEFKLICYIFKKIQFRPIQKTVAEFSLELGSSESIIKKSLSSLEKQHFIIKTVNFTPGGAPAASTYQLQEGRFLVSGVQHE